MMAPAMWVTGSLNEDKHRVSCKTDRRHGKVPGESNVETYITTCKIDGQWEFALRLRELTQESVTT